MPFYIFSCKNCNHTQEHLLKLNESVSECPSCQSNNYEKQVTAPSNVSMEKAKFTPCGKEIKQVKKHGCASGSCGCA